MPESGNRQSFSVDIAGLLEALTEQFPEPLLCVRELVQNAADAAAARIEVDVAYDASRSLMRLAVRDDGRGMNEREVEGYLTIGFSEKNPDTDRGRFGVGKLSPYALGIERMVVETCGGVVTHRIVFNADGSGTINQLGPKPRGTTVRVYRRCDREEAEQLAERTFTLVEETCGSIAIPLFVNGTAVNRDSALNTIYSLPFESTAGSGAIGITAEPTHMLMGAGIVLETGAAILGTEISYILDSPRLSPTLSRNAVRRDKAFDDLLRAARSYMSSLTSHVARQLRTRTDRLRQEGIPVERGLDANDRAALEWLRSLLLADENEVPDSVVRGAPVLETADGGLVSANELIEVIRREGRVPISRVPRTREEIGGYADRGVPVLLLYRDLEDFLERQSITTVEVDGLDDGLEIAELDWGKGEAALANRPLIGKRVSRLRPTLIVATVAAASAAVLLLGPFRSPTVIPPTAPTAAVEHTSTHTPGPKIASRPPATNDGVKAADVVAPRGPRNRALVLIAGLIALLSGAAGFAMIYATLRARKRSTASWLRSEAGAPLTVGENRKRRLNVWSRAIFHPIDFFVARGWSLRAAGSKPLAASAGIKGYREFAPESPIRSGVRLDLDRVQIGFVDLVSESGDAHDGRILVRRQERVLLNRNHPTVRDLISIAAHQQSRARMLLDVLLATDPELGRGTDPRQVEWDLLGRAEHMLRKERK